MEFINQKCNIIEMGKGSKRLTRSYKIGNTFINTRTKEKTRVTFPENLSTANYLYKIIGETYILLRNVRVAPICMFRWGYD